MAVSFIAESIDLVAEVWSQCEAERLVYERG